MHECRHAINLHVCIHTCVFMHTHACMCESMFVHIGVSPSWAHTSFWPRYAPALPLQLSTMPPWPPLPGHQYNPRLGPQTHACLQIRNIWPQSDDKTAKPVLILWKQSIPLSREKRNENHLLFIQMWSKTSPNLLGPVFVNFFLCWKVSCWPLGVSVNG